MNKQRIIDELNIAIPYFIFYQAILLIYSLIMQMLGEKSWGIQIIFYFLSFIAVFLLIKAGLEIQKKTKKGIILFCLYVVLLLSGLMARSFYGIYDLVVVAMGIFLVITNKQLFVNRKS